ncbi:MAG: DNA alkylation repair protein, partial [Planctomycetota bacterium]
QLESRKGARRVADVPKAVLAALHAGKTETRNLTEQLAVDFVKLAKGVGLNASHVDPAAGFMDRLRGLARGIDDWRAWAEHRSDLVREAACLAMAEDAALSAAKQLREVRRFADDGNAGVREIAWLAVRPSIASELDKSIKRLVKWTNNRSPNLRRFAVEVTRPRGVWCAHIAELKDDPSPGLVLLDPLRADTSKYVQDSVANWLNDASKSQPAWVREVCDHWSRGEVPPATERIVRRALRTIDKSS